MVLYLMLAMHIVHCVYTVIIILLSIGAVARSRAAFGPGNGSIFMDNVVCDGNEVRLTDCASNPLAAHNCLHSEDAGVVCQPAISRKFNFWY